jgi:hypothetical protein
MKLKTLIATAAAAVLAVPLSTLAAGDGGAEAMFKALDKNTDGSISKDEAKGTPHDKDFAKLDKNRDGKLSRQEHAAAPEHAGAASSSSGAGSTGAKSGSKY